MTPQLQQAIRLLQLSTLDLQQEIQETLDSNPMLEALDPSETDTDSNDSTASNDISLSENLNGASSNTSSDDDNANEWSDNIPDELPTDSAWDDVYQNMPTSNYSSADSDAYNFEVNASVTESIRDHLIWQLNLTPMSDVDRLIAITIIDSVNNEGYLKTSTESIVASVNIELTRHEEITHDEVELDEVEAVLHRLQHFDPIGVCARDIGECLTIQLMQLPSELPLLAIAKDIVGNYLHLLGNRDYVQLMRRTKLKEEDLLQVIQLIQSLNPRPGEIINDTSPEYVIPDVVVRKNKGNWTVELNPDAMPKVKINATYAAMVKRADNSNDNTYLRNHLQEARWFLKSLQSRNETLLKVASEIVKIQSDFLDFGAEAMKPLVLHDIATAVDMHESTISRVTTQKFMHTPAGIFELKYFFSSHVDTDSGMGCSSTAIRAIIKKLVAAETPTKPLSDSKIAHILADQGIKVARRTIAKYREALMIPPSNERKQLI